ncbi:uncharacterized protein C19orf47 homolog isoform X2 [Petromyzon marinus]|uniref:Uncharacterized protein C19orf47 homolog n=1 Tax=Petromyzon marinus TaxID=7757 RepID=A0AAJ7SQE1_PETMA|nr:uncharacterized protein C19orf47 homolog [Petromyzon marinus]
MASAGAVTSEWIQFFKDAGIPVGPAANYAVTFTDNRIQKSMLMDLSREILHEMGIAVVGDVIAILKHAKVAHQQEIGKVAGIQTKSSGVLSTSSSLKRGQISPASRMIANSLSRDSPPNTPTRAASPEAPKLSFTVANRLGARPKPVSERLGTSVSEAQPEEVPVKRRRRVTAEMEGKYVVNMPKGITSRTKKILEQQTAKKKPLVRNSVFDRLGAESKPDTTTGTKPTGVFSRLGKVVAEDDKASSGGSSESQDNDEDTGSVLQYAGVLKRARLGLGKAAPRPTSSAFLLRASKPPVVTAIKRLAVTRSGGGSGSSVSKSKAGTSVTLVKKPTAGILAGPSREGLKEQQQQPPRRPKVLERLGKHVAEASSSESRVSSSSGVGARLGGTGAVQARVGSKALTVTIKRTAPSARVSSSSGNGRGHSSQGVLASGCDDRVVSVFDRLGNKTVA